MKVLLLAPQPCYVDRGTPIAVDLTVATLCDAGYEVDLLTFPGGVDRDYAGLRTFRVGKRFSSTPARAGLSAKKLALDFLMLWHAIALAARNRYTLVHAVEESSFIALVLRLFFRIPYITDMDSRITTQLTDRFGWLKPLDKALWWLETVPARFASGVIAMCDSLQSEVLKVRKKNVFVVKDVSLLDYYGDAELSPPPELAEIRARHNKLLMYIGNLETYQGIDLMLGALGKLPRSSEPDTALVIVGGDAARIQHFQKHARELSVEKIVYFLGPQPVGLLRRLMAEADVMLSPRTQGTNTPLKLYSYLDSGVPVLATNLETHTQVVDHEQAMLCEPNPDAMALAIEKLLANADLRTQIASNAKELIETHHSLAVFRRQMLEIYRTVIEPESAIGQAKTIRQASTQD